MAHHSVFGDKFCDVFDFVLTVSVHCQYCPASAFNEILKSRAESRSLPPARLMLQYHSAVFPCDLCGPVPGTVIHYDHQRKFFLQFPDGPGSASSSLWAGIKIPISFSTSCLTFLLYVSVKE